MLWSDWGLSCWTTSAPSFTPRAGLRSGGLARTGRRTTRATPAPHCGCAPCSTPAQRTMLRRRPHPWAAHPGAPTSGGALLGWGRWISPSRARPVAVGSMGRVRPGCWSKPTERIRWGVPRTPKQPRTQWPGTKPSGLLAVPQPRGTSIGRRRRWRPGCGRSCRGRRWWSFPPAPAYPTPAPWCCCGAGCTCPPLRPPPCARRPPSGATPLSTSTSSWSHNIKHQQFCHGCGMSPSTPLAAEIALALSPSTRGSSASR
mmetsp:Transcript_11599/g.34845  ORF Transcript_11599/g.34845 Transcript_11599/m.34845 type:complete len:258 (-) Transcript_11599:1116-1889(-)